MSLIIYRPLVKVNSNPLEFSSHSTANRMNQCKIDDFVMPGDEISTALPGLSANSKIILGPGLRQVGEKVLACKAGPLRLKSNNLIWVDSIQKRYIPSRGETVIGTVVQKAGDIFRIDIGANELSALPYLSFEGATKKNRPDVQVGDLVFAKILVANKDFETELICMDSMGKKQRLGVLRDGFVFDCEISTARKLRNNDSELMKLIPKNINVPLDIVIGMNGRIWINSRRERDTIAVANAILAAQCKGDQDFSAIFNQIHI